MYPARFAVDYPDRSLDRLWHGTGCGEPVTLRGRIVNDSPGQRRLSTVTVRAAWSPLTSRADVTHWLEGRDQRETGWVLGEDAVGPVVVPGASVPFTVEAS